VPRDLSDVLHYLIPEASDEVDSAPPPSGRSRPAALPLVALPIGDRDVVRAGFAWNLVVEIARLGGSVSLVAPAGDDTSPLWPQVGPGPLGTEVVVSDAEDLGALHRASVDTCVARAAGAEGGGVVFVRVPPTWLCGTPEAVGLLRWTLLFTTPEERELLETYGLAKLARGASPEAQIGITIHGVRARADAQRAFEKLWNVGRRHLRAELRSYGLLVDDLHVYRAIAAQRPIGIAQPQSPAARALRDVAGLLLSDARERAIV